MTGLAADREIETTAGAGPAEAGGGAVRMDSIVRALKSVFDPEIPVSIYDLGLIYDIDIRDAGRVAIVMTLTAPGCPVAGEMPGMIERAVQAVDNVTGVDVTLTFDPPWDISRMSDAARLELGMY